MRLNLLPFLTLTLSLLPSTATANQNTKHNLSPPATIVAPSAGQLLPAGTPFTITWSSSPALQSPSALKIDILLFSASVKTVTPILTIAKGIANTGSFTWDVPTTLESGENKYKVDLVVEGVNSYDIECRIGIANQDYHVRPGGENSTTERFGTSTATATGRVVSWSGSASGSVMSTSSSVSKATVSSSAARSGGSGSASGSAAVARETGGAAVYGVEGGLMVGAAGLIAAMVL